MSDGSGDGAFDFVGGRTCLDFTNTVGGRVRETGRGSRAPRWAVVRDRFGDYDDLVAWARGAGLLGDEDAAKRLRLARRSPAAADEALARAVALREVIYHVFDAVVDDRAPAAEDVDALNRALDEARDHERLVYADRRFAWAWDDDAALESILWPVAASAAELLASGNTSRVRRCGGEQCGWLFFDSSRSGRRQWCDMRDCGNLAKVRRFRERRRSADES